jgi:hypothetical protein
MILRYITFIARTQKKLFIIHIITKKILSDSTNCAEMLQGLKSGRARSKSGANKDKIAMEKKK